MNTQGPLNLPGENALKIEREILALQPFRRVSWEDAMERYLILRWVLGLGPASVREITDGLVMAKFWHTIGRTDGSCRSAVYRVFYWNDRFRVTDPRERRWIRGQPRQFARRPSPKPND